MPKNRDTINVNLGQLRKNGEAVVVQGCPGCQRDFFNHIEFEQRSRDHNEQRAEKKGLWSLEFPASFPSNFEDRLYHQHGFRADSQLAKFIQTFFAKIGCSFPMGSNLLWCILNSSFARSGRGGFLWQNVERQESDCYWRHCPVRLHVQSRLNTVIIITLTTMSDVQRRHSFIEYI